MAFPQHGVFYTDSISYLKEAAKMDVDFIGGVDPFSIDGAIEKTMDFTVQLALDNNKGIDIHLHETGDSGLKTVEYMIKKVNENPVLKDKTTNSVYWNLGKLLFEKQLQEGYGSSVVKQRSIDVKTEFPDMGLSLRNLWNMNCLYVIYYQ